MEFEQTDSFSYGICIDSRSIGAAYRVRLFFAAISAWEIGLRTEPNCSLVGFAAKGTEGAGYPGAYFPAGRTEVPVFFRQEAVIALFTKGGEKQVFEC